MNSLPCHAKPIPIILCALLAVLLISCAPSGPQRPQPGTPAFQWLTAKEASKSGDFVKTNDLLVPLAMGSGEYAEQARPWALLTSLGMAGAYIELSEKLEEGSRKSRETAPFRRASISYRAKAQAAAMQYLELSRRFTDANQDKDVTLAFELPSAGFTDPPEYLKITGGRMLPQPELATVEAYVIRHEMLQNVCRALDTPKDLEKAKAAYQNGEAKASGPVFLLTVAQGLYDVGEMFGPRKLDQPPRILGAVYSEALEVLALVKDNKDAKNLTKKIGDAKKKLRLT